MVDLIEELKEQCRDANGNELPDRAEPWSINCGLIRKAIARIRDLERIEAALERVASLSMSQFASASDMAGECVNVAREALTGGRDGR